VPQPKAVPSVVGLTLEDAGTALADSSLPVEVRFPGYVDDVFGFEMPERKILLQEVSTAHHLVADQSPTGGPAPSSIATITLVAGEHPNRTGTPWFRGHAVAVKAGSASRCFECHDERPCARCHEEVLR